MSDALSGISETEFALVLEKIAPLSQKIAPKIAVAVSGGPDSMALAFCVKRAGYECIGLIVDHGLREESAREAAQVQTALNILNIPCEILHWQHEGITNRIHERARAARYHLLTEACRRHGASDLMTAHHQGDQAETILMRIAKGSSVEGLAGIAAQMRRDDVRILRPFLTMPKEKLIATCRENKINFVTDPSNVSDKFARGRLRKIMPLLEQEGLTTESLIRLGARAAEAASALDHAVQEFLQKSAKAEIGGSIKLARASLSNSLPHVPRAIALRALASCLRYVHPDDYPPDHDGLDDTLTAILTAQGETTRSFYGCLISMAENHVTILREPAGASEILPLHAGQSVLWDKRWLVSADPSAPVTQIRALGAAPHEIIDNLAPRLRHDIPQGRIRATLPALWQGDTLHAIPVFGGKSGFRMIYRKQTFP